MPERDYRISPDAKTKFWPSACREISGCLLLSSHNDDDDDEDLILCRYNTMGTGTEYISSHSKCFQSASRASGRPGKPAQR